MAGVRQLKVVGKRDLQSLLLQDQCQQCRAKECVRTCLRPRWGSVSFHLRPTAWAVGYIRTPFCG